MESNDDKTLKYKIQDPFFIDYYKLRNEAIHSKNLILLGEKEKVILSFSAFLDYTCDYVFKYDEKAELLNNLFENYLDMELKEFREKINKFWLDINADHVKFEILPKPESSTEDQELENFWKEETHKGVREIKKVMVDIYNHSF